MERIEKMRFIMVIFGIGVAICCFACGVMDLLASSEEFEALKAAGAIPESIDQHYGGLISVCSSVMVILAVSGLIPAKSTHGGD